jgi:hypothetical protein
MSKFHCLIISAILCVALASKGLAQWHFEAEELVINKEVIIKDKMRPDLWTLWSTDKDADKKWSGGVVIRSPEVKADRASPEEGAPILHVSIPMPESGYYDIHAYGINRPIGLSLDGGKTWMRQSNTLIAESIAADGQPFTCAFDDAFAHPEPKHRGATYLDYFKIVPALPMIHGVKNPDFEASLGTGKSQDACPPGWGWWSRDAQGQVRLADDARTGQHAAQISYQGGKDWAFTNAGKLNVATPQRISCSAWIKISTAANASGIVLQCVGSKDNKLVKYGYASVNAKNTHAWQQLSCTFDSEDDVDQLRLRIIGRGDTDILVDDVSLEPAP